MTTSLQTPTLHFFFKVGEKTVYALAQTGELPDFKVGVQWRLRRTAIELWIDERTITSQLEPAANSAHLC